MAFKLTPTYSSKLQARIRWLQVLRSAQEPAGGSWDPDFEPEYMTPRRLRQLADVIDSQFLQGSFARVCAPTYAVQDVRLTPEEAGDCDRRACRQATAGFEPSTNTVFFYRPSWHKQPSLSCPVQADGVYCTNRLQWLAHTLGHEMVHAIVHHACPEARSMQAYTASHGHGPIFLALNKHIFGHDTARYRAGWGRLRPHLKVQPLQVTHSFQQGVSSEEGCESEQGQGAQLAVVGDATCLQRSGSGSEDWECTMQLQQQQQQQLGLHSEQQQPLLRSKAVTGASAAQRPHAQWLWKQFADK